MKDHKNVIKIASLLLALVLAAGGGSLGIKIFGDKTSADSNEITSSNNTATMTISLTIEQVILFGNIE